MFIIVLTDIFSKFTKLYSIKNQKFETIRRNLEEYYFQKVGVSRAPYERRTIYYE